MVLERNIITIGGGPTFNCRLFPSSAAIATTSTSVCFPSCTRRGPGRDCLPAEMFDPATLILFHDSDGSNPVLQQGTHYDPAFRTVGKTMEELVASAEAAGLSVAKYKYSLK